MTQISVGNLLPNLKVTLGNDVADNKDSEEKVYDLSEEKASDSNENPTVQIVRSWMDSLQKPKIYKNKTGAFTTGLDLLSEDNIEKLDKRAERFGLEKDESSLPLNISSLYESMGLSTEDKNSAKMKNMRLDAVHMRGVNDMSTNEIFQYFIDYGAASVEWINDFSCNVVWLDETSCARALLGVSKPLNQSKTNTVIKDIALSDSDSNDTLEPKDPAQNPESPNPVSNDKEDETEMDVEEMDSEIKSNSPEPPLLLSIPIPPGHWRLGTPHPKAKTILLRFATKDDKKLPGAEKRSDYYKRYGNPNYGGLKGLISSSRKRKMQAAVTRRTIEIDSSKSKDAESMLTETPECADDSLPKVFKPKPPPRMRMYADDEELKTRKLKLSDNLKKKPQSVHSRLGSKYTRDDLCHLGSYPKGLSRNHSDPEDEFDLDELSSVSRNAGLNRKRDWPSENQVDLRTKLKRLRSDNVKKHRSPLCVDSDSGSED